MACLTVKILRAAFVKLRSRFGLAVIHRNTLICDNSAPIYRVTAVLHCKGEKLIGLACLVVLSQGLFRSLSLFRVPGGNFTAIMNGCENIMSGLLRVEFTEKESDHESDHK
jgi:hypothetical protein